MRCRNCGAELQDRYCASCGQDSRDPPEDLPGIVGTFSASLTGLESRALRSFFALLLLPGRLTRAYLDGRRVRYSSPAQLYLWCTAAFFLTQSVLPIVRLDPDTGRVLSTLSLVSISTGLTPETLARLEAQGTPLTVFAERFDAAATAYFPLLLVLLVVGVAGLMALQYRKESALKHAVFALHWCAFYFTLEMARRLLPSLGDWGIAASVGASLIAVTYLMVAMRAVYGRSRVGTAARGLLTIVAFSALLGAWLASTTALAERFA